MLKALLRSALLSAEVVLASLLVAVSCATSPDHEPVPVVVVGQRTLPPEAGGDIRYYLTVDWTDDGGYHCEEIEVTWREYLFFGAHREACAVVRPGWVTRLVACR